MYTYKNRVLSLLATIVLLVSGNMALFGVSGDELNGDQIKVQKNEKTNVKGAADNEDEIVKGEVYRLGWLLYLGEATDSCWNKDTSITIGPEKSDMMSMMKNNPSVVVSAICAKFDYNDEASEELVSRYVKFPASPALPFFIPFSLLKILISEGNLDGKVCRGKKCVKFNIYIDNKKQKSYKKQLNKSEKRFNKDLNYSYSTHDKEFLLEHGVIVRDPETGEYRHGPNGYKKDKRESEEDTEKEK